MKYGEITLGQIEAIINKLGGEDGVMKFLRGELTVSNSKPARSWREEEGAIRFSVMSDGTTGPEWIERLEKKKFRLSKYAKDVLRSPDFEPTSSITIDIVILKGMLFTDDDRVTKKIRAEAESRKLEKPNAEVACLIREMFTDEEIEVMGLWWVVVMHEPINDSGGGPGLLSTDRSGRDSWLGACHGGLGGQWDHRSGFAFAVPQVSPQN